MARLGRVLRSVAASPATVPGPSCFAASAANSRGTAAAPAANGAAHGLESDGPGGAQGEEACCARGRFADIQDRDSAFEGRHRHNPAAKMAQLVLERPVEVMPDCQAKVQLAAGDVAVTEDALASKAAMTIAPPAALEQPRA
jgi:hypothetical protein